MKRTRIIVGVLTLSIMALAFCASIASAADFDLLYPLCSGNGDVWQVNTLGLFSGKDVDPTSVKAEYLLIEGGDWTEVEHNGIILNKKFIILLFYAETLPNSALQVRVTGTVDGQTFVSSGPGWVYRFH